MLDQLDFTTQITCLDLSNLLDLVVSKFATRICIPETLDVRETKGAGDTGPLVKMLARRSPPPIQVWDD
ncbi:MAG: hypothetical protein ABIR32_22620 [Ilumatobacteraceae bacterium]